MLSLALIFWLLTRHNKTAASTSASRHCGSSVEQALLLGCEFDLPTYSWTPKPCMEYETYHEYVVWASNSARKRGAYPYFKDEEGQVRIPDETALSLHTEMIFSTWEDHLAHCTFMARRLYRKHNDTSTLTLPIENDLEHSLHRSRMLLGETERPEHYDIGGLNTRFFIRFARC